MIAGAMAAGGLIFCMRAGLVNGVFENSQAKP
jgi:hypothetical protein